MSSHHPITSYWSWSSTSSGRMPMMADGQLSLDPSPSRDYSISANPGRGHWGLWLDCSSIFSWEGAVVGTSASLVMMGQLTPWATNRAPLRQAWQLLLWQQLQSHGVGSNSLGRLTSTQLEGLAAAKTSSFIKETSGSIAHQSSTTLSARWHGWLGISGWALSTQY